MKRVSLILIVIFISSSNIRAQAIDSTLYNYFKPKFDSLVVENQFYTDRIGVFFDQTIYEYGKTRVEVFGRLFSDKGFFEFDSYVNLKTPHQYLRCEINSPFDLERFVYSFESYLKIIDVNDVRLNRDFEIFKRVYSYETKIEFLSTYEGSYVTFKGCEELYRYSFEDFEANFNFDIEFGQFKVNNITGSLSRVERVKEAWDRFKTRNELNLLKRDYISNVDDKSFAIDYSVFNGLPIYNYEVTPLSGFEIKKDVELYINHKLSYAYSDDAQGLIYDWSGQPVYINYLTTEDIEKSIKELIQEDWDAINKVSIRINNDELFRSDEKKGIIINFQVLVKS